MKIIRPTSDTIISMESKDQSAKKYTISFINFTGKNRRFYASGAAMLALILAPFALYAALDRGNTVLSALFFAVIAGTMVLVVILS